VIQRASLHGYYFLYVLGVQAARLTQRKRRQLYPNATKQRKGKSNAKENEKGSKEKRQWHAYSQAKDLTTSASEEDYSI
jgi:hypothetical protein